MINPGLKDKTALIIGGNTPFGIGAVIARALAFHGAKVFIHYFRLDVELPEEIQKEHESDEPGSAFFSSNRRKRRMKSLQRFEKPA